MIILAMGGVVLFFLKDLERKKRRESLRGRVSLSIQDNYKLLNTQDIDYGDFVFALKRVAQVLHIEINDIKITDKATVYEVDIPFLIDSDIDRLIGEVYECKILKDINSIGEVSIRDIVICMIEVKKRYKA